MKARFAFFGALAAAAVLAACGGGGGGGGCCPATAPPSTNPPTTPTPPTTVSQNVTFSGSASSATLPTNSLASGSVALPAGSGSATITYSATAPSPGPATIQALGRTPTSMGRVRRMTTATSNTGVIYATITATSAVTMNGVPGFTVTVPASKVSLVPAGAQFFVAFYNTNTGSQAAVWQSSSANGVALSGDSLTIPATTIPSFTLASGQSLYLVVYFGYFIPQVNYNGCVGVQGDSVTRSAQAQLVGVNPPTAGSSWSYTGTLTGAIYESTPCPIPTATQNATVSINVNVTSPPAGTASGFVDEHSVEQDAFTTNTTQVTTDAIVNGTNETSETSTDLTGNTTVTTWGGSGLVYYNVANGFSNGPPATVNSTFVDGTTENRTYSGTAGAYNETDKLLTGGAGGTSTISVLATGAATYNIANIDPQTGSTTPIQLGMSAPTGGQITLSLQGTAAATIQAWYQLPLYSDITSFEGTAALPVVCNPGATTGTSGTEYYRLIAQVDPALGSSEIETIESFVVPSYQSTGKTVGPTCVIISDTQNLYYDFLLNTTAGFFISNNASPLQTSTYSELYYFQSAPTGESRVRAQSIAGAAMAFAVQHSGITFARAVEREQRLQRFVKAAASGHIQGGVR